MMKLHDRYEQALNSVKVSFNDKGDRILMNVFIGIKVAESVGLKPGDYVNVLIKGREFQLEPSEKRYYSYKLQDIEPKTRNNYRIQFTYKGLQLSDNNFSIRIVKHKITKEGYIYFKFE